MRPYSIALMVYGDIHSGRDALSEDKYKDLANALLSAGFTVQSVLYNDALSESLYSNLLDFDAILVWVNPIEQGKDRRNLDSLLAKLAGKGCLISTHPDVILKIGTKDVLFKTKEMGWGVETKLYSSYEDFVERFPKSLEESGIKVLKQYRGNGGNGVFKIVKGSSDKEVTIIHAKNSDTAKVFSWSDFYKEFRPYFSNGGLLIEQEWNNNHANGMVRCYLCGNKVAGFGYQEINALYEITTINGTIHLPPGKRYYFTENCGLFSDLKEIMENSWVPQLQESQSIATDMLPVIWDADFFINNIHSTTAIGKYSLCEINVSSVSPFPPSAIKFMVEEIDDRIRKKRT
ncbi:MAG: Cj0069 family protein [Bacteroidota bacterium]|nr:Cj0069 family protein [Flavisolibacter sp.]MBD0298411.1 Cj0069 family protein [Flavisolibacter sp.]MBD0367304.1 Cj0069 family protein [Flavisolibacter sp.]MBD0378443.1 Cj0069 family protein [Flavisolibacter sp.]MDQ3844394.1 Cj0069 family protein [Bacteroidota bacterium]